MIHIIIYHVLRSEIVNVGVRLLLFYLFFDIIVSEYV